MSVSQNSFSQADVVRLRQHVGCDVSALLTLPFPPEGLSFLSVEEIEAAIAELDGLEIWRPKSLLPLWRVDNGAWLGCHMDGILKGMLSIVRPDCPQFAPQFLSVDSAYRAFSSSSLNHGVLSELPLVSCDVDERQRLLTMTGLLEEAAATLSQSADLQERVFLLTSALMLLPPGETERLIRGVRESNPEVKATACRISGAQRDEGTISALKAAAVDCDDNGTFAAISALGEIGTPAAIVALQTVASRIDSGFDVYMHEAFRAAGLQVREVGSGDARRLEYQFGSEWKSVCRYDS